MRRCALGLAALFIGAAAPIAQGQVYKCVDASGKTTYADAPCDAKSKPQNLPDPSRKSATDPNMCAQLSDELDRLSAEAERSASMGRTPSASSVNRRKSLNRQYEARCVGVARSDPKRPQP
jgi:hypothetical protein